MKANSKQSPAVVDRKDAGEGQITEGGLDDLRVRVLSTIETQQGLTQEQAAKEAEMSPTTLSLWLQGKYPGNNANVEAKLRKWLETRGERLSMQTLVAEAPAFVASQTATEITNAFRYAQTLEDMVSVVGVPGIGKSTTCQEYQRQYSNVWIVEMASHTTGVVPVLKEICEAVGGDRASGASGLAREIKRKIRGTHGLLIVDEAHHLTPQSLDAIRSLHDSTGVAVALVGSVELSGKLEKMPQLYSRLGLRLFRHRVLKADIAALLDAWQIGGKAERQYLARLAQRPGALRSITKVLRLASATARSSGEPLSLRHIEDAALMLSARTTEESDHA